VHSLVVRLDSCSRPIERRAFPWPLQPLARNRDQLDVIGIAVTEFGAEEESHVDAGLGLSKGGNTEWHLDQFLKVVARVISRARGVGQLREMFANQPMLTRTSYSI
jgi:hypothetical protein